jgi:NADPH-dependent 2,4-dienoyl-CoA reductase/sulfur reductase-like enzyme
LRSLQDCRRLIEGVEDASSVAVVGASFIGMEVASSLKERGLDVTVVARESKPFEKVFGPELGSFLQSLHEDHGIEFRLEAEVQEVNAKGVLLGDSSTVDAERVVLGLGVEPDVRLAKGAGLEVEDGVVVDPFLRTSADDVYAAGDVARYPDPRSGAGIRIEHWVHAQRQGRTAARNLLGAEEAYTDVPFFWTRQFGVSVAYVGHAEGWEEVVADGGCGDPGGCSFSFMKDGQEMAFATIRRDKESLRKEAEMEQSLPVLDTT